MTPYPKYKPSGNDWIGEIPEQWSIRRMKFDVNYEKGKNPKDLTFVENGKPYLSMEYLRGNPKQIFYVEGFENFLNVKDNEILLLWDGSNAGEFIKSKYGVLSSTMAVLKIFRNYENFAWYFFKVFERHLKDSTIGMGIPHVNSDEFKNQLFLSPPLPEQQAIANYLDEKTALIDSFIEKKKKLIELLKEERTAIINQAVTKGINPNVKMKPSGIDWLGDIPEHWEVKKLKYVAKLKSGDSITSDDIRPEGEYPVFGGNGLRGYTSKFSHNGKYVLIGRQGALCGNINFADGSFYASEHAVVVTIISNSEFIWCGELLRTMNLNQYSLASAQPGLSVERIQNLYIPYPPIEEQKQIVEFIETETNKIDTTITKIEKEIELMQEYRTALISEVVTGKVRVIE